MRKKLIVVARMAKKSGGSSAAGIESVVRDRKCSNLLMVQVARVIRKKR